MSLHPADSAIFASVFGTNAARRTFSDERFISFMLEVEGALARAEAKVGVIPASAGRAISDAAKSVKVNARTSQPRPPKRECQWLDSWRP